MQRWLRVRSFLSCIVSATFCGKMFSTTTPREGSGRGGQGMARCNDLCTKDATGTCALCEARAEADRFFWFWLKGGFFVDGVHAMQRRGVFALLHRYALPLQRRFNALTKFANTVLQFYARKRRGKSAFNAPINPYARSIGSRSVTVKLPLALLFSVGLLLWLAWFIPRSVAWRSTLLRFVQENPVFVVALIFSLVVPLFWLLLWKLPQWQVAAVPEMKDRLDLESKSR